VLLFLQLGKASWAGLRFVARMECVWGGVVVDDWRVLVTVRDEVFFLERCHLFLVCGGYQAVLVVDVRHMRRVFFFFFEVITRIQP